MKTKPSYIELGKYFKISNMTSWRWQKSRPKVYEALVDYYMKHNVEQDS